MLKKLLSLSILSFMTVSQVHANELMTQKIELNAGWNLISIQVADPETGVLTIPQFLESVSDSNFADGSLSDEDYWNDYVQRQPILEIWTYEGWTPSGRDFSTPSQMVEAYTDPITGETRRSDTWRSFHSANSEWGSTFVTNLDVMRPNKAYWVKSGTRVDIQITGKIVGGDILLKQGWNFIGFNLSPDAGQVTVDSVFGSANRGIITQVWGFDNYTFSQYILGAEGNTLTAVEPGRGYWVYAEESFMLTSEPVILLPGDIDQTPLSREEFFNQNDPRYTGSRDFLSLYQSAGFVKYVLDSDEVDTGESLVEDEDLIYDLNGNGIIDSMLTQNTLYFPAGVNRQYITFSKGIGPSYTWTATTDVAWLQLDRALDVVSGAQSTLTVTVDRTGLAAGNYGKNRDAVIQISTSNGMNKTVFVQMDVPTIAGDWFGYATLQKVNGKSIPLGKVDLFLNMSMEENSSSRFTTVLNSDRSLLFPRDVFMNGVFYTDESFSLTANFAMPRGDINAPGYENFQHAPQVPGKVVDFDADGDGKVDNMNPFPYTLNREITLQGKRFQSKLMRLDGNLNEQTLVPDDRLEGLYVETIRGLLPGDDPITIEGHFVLQREESSFVATKKTAAVLSNSLGQSIGGTNTNTFSDTLIQDTLVKVDGFVEVRVDLNYQVASAYTATTLILVAPDGTEYELQSGDDSLLNGGRYVIEDLDGQLVTGEWTLRVEWNTSERGTLESWSLDIKGTTSHQFQGVVYAGNDSSAVIKDAWVALTGSNIVQNTVTTAAGGFDMVQLNENKYCLVVQSPSYKTATIHFVLDDQGEIDQIQSNNAVDARFEKGVFYIGLEHSNPSLPAPKDFEIVTAPVMSEGPAKVFYARLPEDLFGGEAAVRTLWYIDRLNLGSDLISPDDDTWSLLFIRFSDRYDSDLTDITRLVTTGLYLKPGIYRVRARIQSESDAYAYSYDLSKITTSPDDDTFTILKQSHSDSSSAPELTHWAQLGSLAGRMDGGTGLAVSGNTVYQESKPDTAAFDIDRYPFVGNDNVLGPEDSNHWWPEPKNAVPAPEYQINSKPAHLRCVVRMGFPVFSTNPATAGAYQIHPGWIDPQ